MPNRVDHREQLIALLKPVMADKRTAEWIGILEEANVPCGPINRIDQVFADPQSIARGRQNRDGACNRTHRTRGQPVAPLAKRRRNIARRRRFSGEHTDEILGKELGLPPGEIARLRALAII